MFQLYSFDHDVSGGQRRELDGVPAGQGCPSGRRWCWEDVALSPLQDGRVLREHLPQPKGRRVPQAVAAGRQRSLGE